MIQVKKKDRGSRSIAIDTDYLIFFATVAADGRIEVERCEVREPAPPPPPPDADIRLAIHRAEICRECEHGSNIRLTVESKRGIEPIFKVKCGLCSSCSGGLSLTKGRCKAGKWDQ